MRLALVIRPSFPIEREACDREARALLRDCEQNRLDFVGGIGKSARACVKPYFASRADGTMDKTRVESIEIVIDFADAADIGPIADAVGTTARTTAGRVLFVRDGAPFDGDILERMFRAEIHERKKNRLVGVGCVILGVLLMGLGALLFAGFDVPDALGGYDALTGTREHVYFWKWGALVMALGVAALCGGIGLIVG